VIRSLYLSGEEIFGDNEGLEILYKTIYDLGTFEGYLTVAESFHESMHYEKSVEAFYKAREKKWKLETEKKPEELCERYQQLADRYQKLREGLKQGQK